jgi:hypothetical protein
VLEERQGAIEAVDLAVEVGEQLFLEKSGYGVLEIDAGATPVPLAADQVEEIAAGVWLAPSLVAPKTERSA